MRRALRKLLLLAGVLSACATSEPTPTPAPSDFARMGGAQQLRTDDLSPEVAAFSDLVEQSLAWRLAQLALRERIEGSEVLGSGDLQALQRGVAQHRLLRLEYYQHIERGIEKDRLALASVLMLADDYLVVMAHGESSARLRRHVNQDVPGIESYLSDATRSFYDERQLESVVRAVTVFEEDRSRRTQRATPPTADDAYLDTLVESSFAYHQLQDLSAADLASGKDSHAAHRFRDRVKTIEREGFNEVSKAFGNSVGVVQVRDGVLKSMPAAEQEALAGRLEPLDVLLEKTPFRLTDKLIPGFWGHAALWVGERAQLEALGVWKHEAVRPYHDVIEGGARIVEALRSGVELNTLEHFLDIDDFAVLRQPGLTREQRRRYLVRTFQQIGKEYDFNYDVESDRRIVCSELVYVVYSDTTFKVDKAGGRYTISPDRVAEEALGDGPFEPVVLYHDGVELTGDIAASFQRLLR